MNPRLGLRAFAILVLVLASTLILVKPELIGGSTHATGLALGSLPAVGRI